MKEQKVVPLWLSITIIIALVVATPWIISMLFGK